MALKSYVAFHYRKSLFGNHIYTPYVCDIYGIMDPTAAIMLEQKEKLARYLIDRGFKLKWSHPEHLRYLREFCVVIKSKSQLAQFALINVGVIEITNSEIDKQKQVFKI
jgi:hypothetical protein